MDECADGIHPGIAMGDHDALRTRSGAAGVIDGKQISLANFPARKFTRARVDHCFIVEPVRVRLRTADATSQGDEVFDTWKTGPNAVDGGKIIAVRANHARTTMIDQV